MASNDQQWEGVRSFASTLTPEELSIYEQLNLSPQVIELGKNICAPFPFHEDVKGKLLIAFNLSPSKVSYSQDPGIKDAIQKLISNLCESQPGVSFLAILSVLTPYFNDASVASVFSDLAITSKIQDDLLPSLADWEHLSQIMSTHLTSSNEFESFVDKFTELGVESIAKIAEVAGEVEGVGADSVHLSLRILRKISMGEEEHGPISFYWGPDAGWIAAVAKWLFDLGPKMELCARDRTVLWSGVGNEQAVEARCMFHERGVPVDGEPIVVIPLVLRRKYEQMIYGK